MDYNEILCKLQQYNERKKDFPKASSESYQKAFDIEYTHDSTAIEGNTLSLDEVRAILANPSKYLPSENKPETDRKNNNSQQMN